MDLVWQCCRSSVVERILGKAEVVSSILTGSTISTHRTAKGSQRMEIARRMPRGKNDFSVIHRIARRANHDISSH